MLLITVTWQITGLKLINLLCTETMYFWLLVAVYLFKCKVNYKTPPCEHVYCISALSITTCLWRTLNLSECWFPLNISYRSDREKKHGVRWRRGNETWWTSLTWRNDWTCVDTHTHTVKGCCSVCLSWTLRSVLWSDSFWWSFCIFSIFMICERSADDKDVYKSIILLIG